MHDDRAEPHGSRLGIAAAAWLKNNRGSVRCIDAYLLILA